MSSSAGFQLSSSRLIYLAVILVVAIPLVSGVLLPPARLASADRFYAFVEQLPVASGKIALLAFDFGPGTKAENEPQAEVITEHLMRRRIPVLVFTQYAQAQGFINAVPERVAARLNREHQNKQKWEYGRDWVTVGYRPGLSLFLQALAKSQDIPALFEKDVYGVELTSLPALQDVKSIRDIIFVGEFTGLSGIFDLYVQFLQTKDYTPPLGHGCTSITIPEAYIYLDSGQIKGLLEGVSGAAWYSQLLNQEYPQREPDSSQTMNTALGFAQLLMLVLIVLGNLRGVFSARKLKRSGVG